MAVIDQKKLVKPDASLPQRPGPLECRERPGGMFRFYNPEVRLMNGETLRARNHAPQNALDAQQHGNCGLLRILNRPVVHG